MHEADLLLLLGTDFPYDAVPAAGAAPSRSTIDPTRLGRRTPLDLGRPRRRRRDRCGRCCRCWTQKTDRPFLDDMLRQHARALERRRRRLHPATSSSTGRSTPSTRPRVLDELAADDAVFTVDTGMCNVWAARYITPNGRRRVIGSFLHGSMANALPHAIGAQLADPGRQVDLDVRRRRAGACCWASCSRCARHRPAGQDRGVQQLVARHGQARDAGRRLPGLRDRPPRPSTTPRSPAALGIRADPGRGARRRPRARCARRSRHPGPALVDLVTDPNALSIPPHITREQVTGSRWRRARSCSPAASAACSTSPAPTCATSPARDELRVAARRPIRHDSAVSDRATSPPAPTWSSADEDAP